MLQLKETRALTYFVKIKMKSKKTCLSFMRQDPILFDCLAIPLTTELDT